MSLYNKYRPKSFEELIQCKFSSGMNKENLNHHALLFFGPSGTGKTSAARLCMAEFRNPNESSDLYISGKHPDYYEVNCAVNNGVDDVRGIVSDIVNTMPVSAEYKFIIFDECHMLTTQAQNALLKTVEEPPNHIKFIFCTTEINKVLPAIRTRCQIYPFIKLSESSLLKIIENVIKQEKCEWNDESAKMIVSMSDGSARSAINLLECCLSVFGDSDSVAKVIGTSSHINFYKLTQYICCKDRINSIRFMDEIFIDSIDPNSVMNKYADYIADLIIARLTKPQSCEFDGKQLLNIASCITDILKDFKILQNLKLISKIYVLKAIEKM